MESVLSMESPPFRPRGSGGFLSSNSNGGASASASAGIGGPFSPSGSSGFTSPYRGGNTNVVRSQSPSWGGGVGANNNGGGGESYSNVVRSYSFQTPNGETLEIRNVWDENVEEEMAIIRELIETHPYVAMDTEFPGVVARPVSETFSPDFHYKSLKCNVDLLKIIQLGLTFADEHGNYAKGCPCWQFNFKFDLKDDMFAQDSIDLLVASGISFEDHASRGIDPLHFGELLVVSGLVLDDRVKWVSFHSGYDYAYLLKVLTTQDLPKDEKSFFELLKIYFPTIYDIKYMTSLCDGHFGGLQRLADDLKCPRIGPEHQAGSDSLLTMVTYFALAKAKFTDANGNIDDTKYKNELYGYGNNHTVRKGPMTASHSTINGNGESF
ncbi:hypothetical protein ACHAWU_001503 [Discostella pseudostelligera]|uniref:poly(A)-specific ribonuclease n=1 Tax=Discostella pseudostelligera TaxID=259834 RepID=A0ABD3MVT8_9STRA